MAVVAGTTYTWKQNIKTTQGNGEFGFYIDEYNVNGAWISGQWKGEITTAFNGDKQFSYKPTSTRVKSMSLQYYVTPKSTFDLYIDSVSVSKQ